MNNWASWTSRFLAAMLIVAACFPAATGHAASAPASAPVSVAGGDTHGIAAWSDGTVTGWGYNKFGQVGDGTSIHQYVPKRIDGLSEIVQVAAAGDVSYALDKNGDVWAWGDYYSPYISGDPKLPYQKRGEPVKLEGLSEVAQVAPSHSGFGSIAVHKDGTATLWYPSFREDMTLEVKYVPLKGVKDAKSAVIARNTALFLTADGRVNTLTVYHNFYGRYRSEGELPAVKPFASFRVNGIAAEDKNVFLLRENGAVYRWNEADGKTPQLIQGISGVKEIRTGYNRLFLLKQDGTVWQWNYNAGALAKPYQVKGLSGVTNLWGSTGRFGFALAKSGGLQGWGEGFYAGLSIGSGAQLSDDVGPVPVQKPLTWSVNGEKVSFYGTSGIVDGQLYVPRTSVFEALGIKVKSGQSNPDPKYGNHRFTVWTFSYEGRTVSIKASDPAVLLVNGKVTKDKVSLKYMANTTMFPLETICDILGIPLTRDKATGVVSIG